MTNHGGEQTTIFGEWLTIYLNQKTEFKDHLIFFDHGDPVVWSNVGVISGFYGKKVSRMNQLTQIDILIANSKYEIILLIEIEERQSVPKKIIGDVFITLMCNQFTVNTKEGKKKFQVANDTQFIFAGWASDKGAKIEQLLTVIAPRIQQFSTPTDSIPLENIHFILSNNLDAAITQLQSRIVKMFP